MLKFFSHIFLNFIFCNIYIKVLSMLSKILCRLEHLDFQIIRFAFFARGGRRFVNETATFRRLTTSLEVKKHRFKRILFDSDI